MKSMNINKSNSSQEEINKFNALAEEWWDPNGGFSSLHSLNPLRFEYINNAAPINNKICADVGCGGGILTESLAAEAKHVDGIDLADKALSVAKNHQEKSGINNIEYHYANIESFAKENHQKYDVLTCMEMLEHVPYPSKIIESCTHSVKYGGDLFFSTINRNMKSFIMAIVGAEYILNLLPKGTHEYDCLIKPSELEQWCRGSGLTLVDLVGVSYNPLTKTFSLTDDVSVNYMMHFKKTS
tara:strand:+ start:6943 stop:7665 length:723 start_codon:yes stop_codon:yes gene_type:complete